MESEDNANKCECCQREEISHICYTCNPYKDVVVSLCKQCSTTVHIGPMKYTHKVKSLLNAATKEKLKKLYAETKAANEGKFEQTITQLTEASYDLQIIKAETIQQMVIDAFEAPLKKIVITKRAELREYAEAFYAEPINKLKEGAAKCEKLEANQSLILENLGTLDAFKDEEEFQRMSEEVAPELPAMKFHASTALARESMPPAKRLVFNCDIDATMAEVIQTIANLKLVEEDIPVCPDSLLQALTLSPQKEMNVILTSEPGADGIFWLKFDMFDNKVMHRNLDYSCRKRFLLDHGGESPYLGQPDSLVTGLLVMACHPFEKQWCRAVILELITDPVACNVVFVDYGQKLKIPIKDIVECSDDDRKLPYMSHPCTLYKVHRDLPCDARWTFGDHCYQRSTLGSGKTAVKLRAKFIDRVCKEGSTLTVWHVDLYTADERNLYLNELVEDIRKQCTEKRGSIFNRDVRLLNGNSSIEVKRDVLTNADSVPQPVGRPILGNKHPESASSNSAPQSPVSFQSPVKPPSPAKPPYQVQQLRRQNKSANASPTSSPIDTTQKKTRPSNQGAPLSGRKLDFHEKNGETDRCDTEPNIAMHKSNQPSQAEENLTPTTNTEVIIELSSQSSDKEDCIFVMAQNFEPVQAEVTEKREMRPDTAEKEFTDPAIVSRGEIRPPKPVNETVPEEINPDFVTRDVVSELSSCDDSSPLINDVKGTTASSDGKCKFEDKHVKNLKKTPKSQNVKTSTSLGQTGENKAKPRANIHVDQVKNVIRNHLSQNQKFDSIIQPPLSGGSEASNSPNRSPARPLSAIISPPTSQVKSNSPARPKPSPQLQNGGTTETKDKSVVIPEQRARSVGEAGEPVLADSSEAIQDAKSVAVTAEGDKPELQSTTANSPAKQMTSLTGTIDKPNAPSADYEFDASAWREEMASSPALDSRDTASETSSQTSGDLGRKDRSDYEQSRKNDGSKGPARRGGKREGQRGKSRDGLRDKQRNTPRDGQRNAPYGGYRYGPHKAPRDGQRDGQHSGPRDGQHGGQHSGPRGGQHGGPRGGSRGGQYDGQHNGQRGGQHGGSYDKPRDDLREARNFPRGDVEDRGGFGCGEGGHVDRDYPTFQQQQPASIPSET